MLARNGTEGGAQGNNIADNTGIRPCSEVYFSVWNPVVALRRGDNRVFPMGLQVASACTVESTQLITGRLTSRFVSGQLFERRRTAWPAPLSLANVGAAQLCLARTMIIRSVGRRALSRGPKCLQRPRHASELDFDGKSFWSMYRRYDD